VVLTRRRDVMAELVNRRSTTMWAAAVAAVIVALNVVLLVSLFSA
jgi:manganese transport protein